MIFFKMLFFIFFMVSNIYGLDVTGYLEPVEKSIKQYNVGQHYRVNLLLHPYTMTELNVSDFVGREFLDALYVSEIGKVRVSENNVDVVVVPLTLIIKRKYRVGSTFILKNDNDSILVTLRLPDAVGELEAIDEFILLSAIDEGDGPALYLWGVFLFFLIAMAVCLRIYFRKNKKLSEWKILMIDLKNLNARGQLAFLYKKREMIRTRIEGYEDFFLEIEKNQYSPQWEDYNIKDLMIVKQKLERELNDIQ